MMNNNLKGSLFAIISAIGFGIVPILALYAYEGGVTVITLVFIRFSLTAIFMFSYISLKVRQITVNFVQLIKLFIFGGVIYATQNILYFSALNYIPASLALLVFYTYPIIVAFLTFILGKS